MDHQEGLHVYSYPWPTEIPCIGLEMDVFSRNWPILKYNMSRLDGIRFYRRLIGPSAPGQAASLSVVSRSLSLLLPLDYYDYQFYFNFYFPPYTYTHTELQRTL